MAKSTRDYSYYPTHTSMYSESKILSAEGRDKSDDVVIKKAKKKWSAPVDIQDWSKVMCKQKSNHEEEYDYYNDEDEEKEGLGFMRTPPHEFVAKRMGNATSFSVHEGVGRTLKGRDLSTLRNAIWQKTGFLD